MVPARDDLRPAQNGGVSLWYIATRAGVSDRSDNWILNYARQLVLNEDFPQPLPNYDLAGKKREGIVMSSRWLRAAVDAWFDGMIPAHLMEVANDRQALEDAHKLDQRADALAGAAARSTPAAPALASGGNR